MQVGVHGVLHHGGDLPRELACEGVSVQRFHGGGVVGIIVGSFGSDRPYLVVEVGQVGGIEVPVEVADVVARGSEFRGVIALAADAVVDSTVLCWVTSASGTGFFFQPWE